MNKCQMYGRLKSAALFNGVLHSITEKLWTQKVQTQVVKAKSCPEAGERMGWLQLG